MTATGSLDLVCERRGGRSVLATARAAGLARASRLPSRGGTACLQLATLGPGLLSGDRFVTSGRLERGATLLVTGQMATPIMPGPRAAVSATRWSVADGATLTAIAQPVLPSAASAGELRTDLEVAGSGCAILAESAVLVAGGALRCATFARLDGAFALRDVCTAPHATATDEAVGSVFVVARDDALRRELADAAWELLDADDAVRGGVGGTDLALVVRVRGRTFAVHEAVARIAHALFARRQTLSKCATASGASEAV